jgi:toxin FitB
MPRMLLDTHVLSELVRPMPNPKLQAFVRSQSDPIISALTIHELVFGAERASEPGRRTKLLSSVGGIRSQFAGRIVDVDADVAEQAGRLCAGAAAQSREHRSG